MTKCFLAEEIYLIYKLLRREALKGSLITEIIGYTGDQIDELKDHSINTASARIDLNKAKEKHLEAGTYNQRAQMQIDEDYRNRTFSH
jgi:hypothetical protein